MALKARMTPHISGRHNSTAIGGVTYTSAPGSYVDVPVFVARGLEANGWSRLGGPGCLVGATTERPVTAADGQPLVNSLTFIDTTLGLIVSWVPPRPGFPGAWVNVLTGAPA